jgi:hypothetical protein
MKIKMMVRFRNVVYRLEILRCCLGESVLESGHLKPVWNDEFINPSAQVDNQPLFNRSVAVDLECNTQGVGAPGLRVYLDHLATLDQPLDLRSDKLHLVSSAFVVLFPQRTFSQVFYIRVAEYFLHKYLFQTFLSRI